MSVVSETLEPETEAPHVGSPEIHEGHYSLFGTYWCDTCNSPYCDNA